MKTARPIRRAVRPLPAILTTITIAMAGCGTEHASDDASANALRGGFATPQLPEVGLVVLKGGGFCTGTLVAPQVVLTAAHCTDQAVEGFYTGPGAPVPLEHAERMPSNITRHVADDQRSHPKYNHDKDTCPNTADIGLVHLAAPITDIAPAALRHRSEVSSSSNCLGIGYGVHDGPGGLTVKEKRSGYVSITAYAGDAVRAQDGYAPPGTAGTVVRGDSTNAYTDEGDSGGPIRCDQGIFAVTSCGPAGSVDGWYTLTEPYEPWILANIARWGS